MRRSLFSRSQTRVLGLKLASAFHHVLESLWGAFKADALNSRVSRYPEPRKTNSSRETQLGHAHPAGSQEESKTHEKVHFSKDSDGWRQNIPGVNLRSDHRRNVGLITFPNAPKEHAHIGNLEELEAPGKTLRLLRASRIRKHQEVPGRHSRPEQEAGQRVPAGGRGALASGLR